MIILLVRRAGRFVDVVVLGSAAIKIGRLRSSHVILADDPDASRTHAVVAMAYEHGPALFDLGSAHGTRVNGERINRAVLRAGDVIEIGAHELTVIAVEAGRDRDVDRVAAAQTAAWTCSLLAVGAIEGARWDEAQAILAAAWRRVSDPQWLELTQELGLLVGVEATLGPAYAGTPAWLDLRGLHGLRGIRRALLPLYRARSEDPKTGAAWQARAMEIEIGLDPGDDAPRQIYADWLLDRGDLRGELIAVQLIAALEPSGPQAVRAAELWRVHGPAWSAAFADFGAEVEFRRGFPWRVRYDGFWPDELIALVRGSPTLERVEGRALPEAVQPSALGLDR